MSRYLKIFYLKIITKHHHQKDARGNGVWLQGSMSSRRGLSLYYILIWFRMKKICILPVAVSSR